MAAPDTQSQQDLSTLRASVAVAQHQTSTQPSPNEVLVRDDTSTQASRLTSQQTVADNQEAEDVVPVKDSLYHRLNATGSVQAIAIDDEVIFAGLQGGEIVVCGIPH